MNILESYLKLKKQAEAAQQDADKAEGALELLTKRLKDEFGCNTIKEGKVKLKELRRQVEDSETKFEAAVNKFEKEWDNKNDY